MVRYFNANLAVSDGWEQDKEIAAAVAAAGLEDLRGHFLPRYKLWLKYGRAWYVQREDGRCAPRPTTYWAQTAVCSRTWRSRTHVTTQTITWSWGASAASLLPHTRAIWGNTHVSPSSRQRPCTGSTACLMKSGKPFPSHPGGNASNRCGYPWKPGASLAPGLQHTGPGTRLPPGGSADRSRQASKRTGTKERPRRVQQWILSSLLIHL